MARRGRLTGDERDALLAAHAGSGMSAWLFAREAGVPYTTFLHWKKRGATTAAPRLVPVEIEHREVAHVEVVVGGAVVRVAADFDEALLVRVVRALRTC